MVKKSFWTGSISQTLDFWRYQYCLFAAKRADAFLAQTNGGTAVCPLVVHPLCRGFSVPGMPPVLSHAAGLMVGCHHDQGFSSLQLPRDARSSCEWPVKFQRLSKEPFLVVGMASMVDGATFDHQKILVATFCQQDINRFRRNVSQSKLWKSARRPGL